MKRIIAKICYVWLIIFMLASQISTVCADDVDNEDFLEPSIEKKITNGLIDVSSNNITEQPKTNSRRYVVYDRISKTIIMGKDENVKSAMASTTKVMTATIVLENTSLDEEVTVSGKAGGTGGSRLGVKKGDKITVNDLLYGLMLRSGNDAAVALAEHVGGSVEKFADMMNQKAEEIGLNNTHFVTPHGLDNSEHYTTAYELAKLTDYALQNETFANIVGTKVATIYINDRTMQITNTNELLGVLNGVVGVKTGFTNNAGRCLVTETKRNNMDIITVVLGADTKKFRTNDSIKLIEYTFSNYEMVNIQTKIIEEFTNWKNINEKRINVIQGKKEYLNPTLGEIELQTIPVEKDKIDNIQYEINTIISIEAPVEQWQKIGNIVVKIDDKIIEKVEIINTEPIEKKSWRDYFEYLLEKLTEVSCLKW